MVSVCMATRNGAAFIKAQLASILAQLTPQDEVIISDDCSGDDTLTVIRSFQDSRIRLLESRPIKGITKNFEASIAASTGELIFLADQDDIWLKDRVDKMKQALQRYDLVMSDCRIVDNDLQIRGHSFYRQNKSGKGLLKNLFKNSYMGCCMAFRSNVKSRILPFPSDIPIHDVWIGLVAELYFKVHFMPEVLLLHRRHDSNASTTSASSRQFLSRKLFDRYYMVKNLILQRYYAR